MHPSIGRAIGPITQLSAWASSSLRVVPQLWPCAALSFPLFVYSPFMPVSPLSSFICPFLPPRPLDGGGGFVCCHTIVLAPNLGLWD